MKATLRRVSRRTQNHDNQPKEIANLAPMELGHLQSSRMEITKPWRPFVCHCVTDCRHPPMADGGLLCHIERSSSRAPVSQWRISVFLSCNSSRHDHSGRAIPGTALRHQLTFAE